MDKTREEVKEEEEEYDEEDENGQEPKQTKGDYVLAVYGFPKQDACQVKVLLKPFLTCPYRMRPRQRDDVAMYLHFKEYKEMMTSKRRLNNKYVKNCKLTVEFEGDPPPPPKPEDKPKPAPGTLMKAPPTIKQMKVCSTMEFMDASYHLQVALKTQNAYAELQQIDTALEKRCDHLQNTLKEMKLRHGGLVCEVDRVVECEPSVRSAHKFMFLRRKAQGTGVISVGMHYRNSAIRSATLVQRHLPPQVVELTQILEQMVLPCERSMTSFMYKVYVYTNQSRHLMLVLESNASPIHAFASQIKDFFARGPGKRCPVRSLRVMDPQTFIGGQNVVMGSPFIIEHIGGFLVQLTPSSQMWTDFLAAEKLCNVVSSLLAANPNSVVLEIGTSSAIVGLHLSKRVKKLVSIDKNPLVDLAQMNSQMNGSTITFIGGELHVAFRQAVNLLRSHDVVSAVLTFTRYDVPDAEFIQKLRYFQPLRRLVIVAEANTVLDVILMLSEKYGGTEPLLPVRMVPVDTMPNTKRYVMVVLMLRALDINAKLKRKDRPVYEEPASAESQNRQRVKEEQDRLRALEEEQMRQRKLREEEERRRLAEEQMKREEEERRRKFEEEDRLRVVREELERRRQFEEEERQRELEEERERLADEERERVLERHRNKLRMVKQFQQRRINIMNQERRIIKEEKQVGNALEPDVVKEEYELMRATFRRETQVNDLRRKLDECTEPVEGDLRFQLDMQKERGRKRAIDDEEEDRLMKRRRSQDRDKHRSEEWDGSEDRNRGRRQGSEERDRNRRPGSPDRDRMRGSPDRVRRRGSPDRDRRRGSPDRIRIRGSPDRIRIRGSPDRDRKRGSPERDRKRGSPERDRKRGSPERDRKRGSPDRDRIRGSPDRDRRRGSPDRDRIRGSPDRDRKRGSPDRIRIRGSPDRDRKRGSPERDRRRGSPDRDRIRGSPDRDRRRGSPDRDRIRGSPDMDRRRLDDRRGRVDDEIDRLRRDRRDNRLDIRDRDRNDDRSRRRRYEDDESGPSQTDSNVADDTIKTLAQVITEALWKVTKAVKESAPSASNDNMFVRRGEENSDNRPRQYSPPRRYDSDPYGRL